MNYSKRKEFYLTIVRHGQTIANELKTIQGHSNTALTKLGLEQAKSLANYFQLVSKLKFDRSFSSDLTRAYETCRIITSSCSKSTITTTNCKIITDTRLRERCYGKLFEGRPISQLIQEAIGQGYDENNFTNYTPDGVESMEEMHDKIRDFFHTTLFNECQNGDEVLIVSHWGTIKEILKLFLPNANGQIRKEHLKETANVAFSRFKLHCKSSSSSSISSSSLSSSENNNGSLDEFIIDTVQVISLHQTPHLTNDQCTVNVRQQVE